jgi:pimeloyl-ACP methyl ester carboxylesterase
LTAPTTTLRVPANGLELHVNVWEASPEVTARGVAVLLHGFQDVGASFDLVAPSLAAEGLRVCAPDLRGFGQSGRIAGGAYYHFPDYVFDVADLVDALSPDAPIFLVGHSMGGTIASMYAGTYPERVALLALLEGVGPPAMPDSVSPDRVRHWVEGVRKTRARPEKAMTFDEVMRRLSIGHPSVPADVLQKRARQLARQVSEGSDLFSWTFDPLHRTTSPISFGVGRWKAHAARITAPTLVVGGGTTGFHPEDEADRIATFATSRRIDLEGAGHMMHWTQPAELSAALVSFVRDNA